MVTPESEPEQDADPAVEAFWSVARVHARLSTVPSYFGPTPLESIPPPSWSFGADEGLDALLAERSSTLVGPRADYGDELPAYGALGIVCDASGRPRALVVTTTVEVTDVEVREELTVVWTPEDH